MSPHRVPPTPLSIPSIQSQLLSQSVGSTPLSAIDSSNGDSPSEGDGGSSSRRSLGDSTSTSGSTSASYAMEPPIPMSASSSSSSSNPLFDWPPSSRPGESAPTTATISASFQPYLNQYRLGPDPFDTVDTVDPSSSSSEDDQGDNRNSEHGHGLRRGSHFRSSTDPLINDGIPIDLEFTSAGPPIEGYDFDFSQQHQPPPAFIRTFSSPLPNRVGYLRHPLSPTFDSLGSAHPPISIGAAATAAALGGALAVTPMTAKPLPSSPLHSLSVEFADSLQAAIQTLLHLSPPHLLDNAKEQYSGCTVQVPATSLSALLTSMRGLNYLSAHAEDLSSGSTSPADAHPHSTMRKGNDFDIGELLQSVADMLSGQAAQKSVDFVLFHGDVGIKHVSVNGDGEGLSFVLGHILRQILLVANAEDTIELGLQVIPQSPSMTPKVGLPLTASDLDRKSRADTASSSRSSSPGRTLPSPPSGHADGPLLCVFEIVHNLYQSSDSTAVTPKAELNPFTTLAEDTAATKPKLDSVLCRRLLLEQNAMLRTDVQPSSPLGSGMPRRAYELSILLPRGAPIIEPTMLSVEEEAIRQPFTSLKLAREPTLGELSSFAESLRGRKVYIHANLSSVFARHLTSYLAAWGMDISHFPIDGDEADRAKVVAAAARHDSGYGGSTTSSTPGSEVPTFTAMSLSGSMREGGRFVMIDDDVAVLRRELFRIRAELQPLTMKPRLLKRPTMSSRTRSSPQVRPAPNRPPGAVLIHFTSLARYNQVREVVSSFVGGPWSAGAGAFVHPEVMVIPKPVGPRRFLTALHTAVSQPIVDPFFSPIATSPKSPGGGYFPAGARTPLAERDGGFFDSVAEESGEEAGPARAETGSSGGSQKARSPLGEFPPSAAQIVRTEQGLHLALPTPGDILATPANEYFSAAAKTSASSGGTGANGVVMQSPDGRPFGMFFEPPVKNERRGSTARLPSESLRRRPTSRRTSGAEEPPVMSPAHSPQTARRISTTSTATGQAEERRGSVTERPASSRLNSRRRTTLPVADSPPVVGVGRDRSSTITRDSRRTSPIVSPKPDQAAFQPPRVPKKTPLPELEDVKRVPVRPAKKQDSQDVVVPPINVLIVEDNPINQNILSMFLRKKKIKHQSAKDGAEAVEKWRTGGFHLILMDIQLPVMDGIEATKEIRKLERNNNIGVFPSTPSTEIPTSRSSAVAAAAFDAPVPASPFRSSVIIVALTASSLQSDRVNALAAGCNDFLTKPVSLKWLDKKIVEWGCMQALIDFDGWRRWKSSDKDPNETKKGFTLGPQQAAKTLASRLRIERKATRSPTSTLSTSTLNAPATSSQQDVGNMKIGMELHVQSPTPVQEESPIPSPSIPKDKDTSENITRPAMIKSSNSSTSLSSIKEDPESHVAALDQAMGDMALTSSDKPLPPLPSD